MPIKTPKLSAAWKNRLWDIAEKNRAATTFNKPTGAAVSRFGPPASQAWRGRVAEIMAVEKKQGVAQMFTPARGRAGAAAGVRPTPRGGVAPIFRRETTPVEPIVEPGPGAAVPNLQVGPNDFGPSVPAADQIIDVSPVEQARGAVLQGFDSFHGERYGFSESEGDFGDLEQDLGLVD